MHLQPVLFITLSLLLVTQLQTIAAEENGSGLDDKDDTEIDNVNTLTCKTNKDCAESTDDSGGTVYYPFSYCNSGSCACLEGRIWDSSKEKCICTDDGREKQIGGCKDAIKGACNKLTCNGDNSCRKIKGGAYCECELNYSGPYCKNEDSNPASTPVANPDPTPIPKPD